MSLPQTHQVSLGLRGLGYRVSGLGVLGLGYRVSGLGFWGLVFKI